MSKRHYPKKRLYSEHDFKKATRLERLHMYLMQPRSFDLKETDENYLELLKKAFCILSEHLSMRKAVELVRHSNIENNPQVLSMRYAYQVINDCQELFGNVIKRNKEFDRMVICDRLIENAERARKEMDLENERRALEAVGKFKRLDKDDKESINAEDIQLPPLLASDDPRILELMEAEDAEIDEEE